jgi:Type IV secretory system Conjugative DNA transfer
MLVSELEHVLMVLAVVCIAAVFGGWVLARELRRRGLRWTWAALGFPVALLVAGHNPLVFWPIFWGCVSACAIGGHWHHLDITYGADHAQAAHDRIGVSGVLRRWSEQQAIRRDGWIKNGRLVIGRDIKGMPVSIPVGYTSGSHTLVVGATGSGKTVSEAWIAGRLIEAGHGAVVIDPKGDQLLRDELQATAEDRGASAAIGMMLCTSAHAGQWIQVSCENPNLTAAASQGWTSFTTGDPGYGSNTSTGCGPGDPMSAILSADAPAEVYSGENLQYTPPKGSTLAGGQVDASMDADGGGYDAGGTAIAFSPESTYNGSNVLFQCDHGQTLCYDGTNDFSGVLDLPSNKGGDFYIGAGCGGNKGAICDEGGSYGAWSLVQVWWANFLLANTATPAATNLGGTLLNPNARGTQELVFDASDAEGPGVYNITAQIDGQTVYSATPNNNSGECAPVGESSGVLMFDSSQPCPASESVELPVNTTSLLDGQHTLKLLIEDAATNTSVAYDGTITTHNAPQNTSPPSINTEEPLALESTLSANPGPGPHRPAPAASPTPTSGKPATPKTTTATRSPPHKTPPTPPHQQMTGTRYASP